jgi:hypothetical protein
MNSFEVFFFFFLLVLPREEEFNTQLENEDFCSTRDKPENSVEFPILSVSPFGAFFYLWLREGERECS